jgi:site-specific recombinase XerD
MTDADQTRALAPLAQSLGVSAETAANIRKARAANTLRGYSSDLADFERYCQSRGATSLPADPAVVADYLTSLQGAGFKAATINRRLAAIAFGHRLARQPDPTKDAVVRENASGIRREIGAPQRQARAFSTADVRAMVIACPANLIGSRDRALILLGFGGGFRRSEIVALHVEDVTEDVTPGQEGLRVRIIRSKTDQEAKGREVGIRRGRAPLTDAMAAVADWRAAAGISTGPLFQSVDKGGHVGGRLSDRAVALILKVAAKRAGLDPEAVSGHSLRAGLATSAARAGATPEQIMSQTGHKSAAMVARYVRAGGLLGSSNVGNLLDL